MYEQIGSLRIEFQKKFPMAKLMSRVTKPETILKICNLMKFCLELISKIQLRKEITLNLVMKLWRLSPKRPR